MSSCGTEGGMEGVGGDEIWEMEEDAPVPLGCGLVIAARGCGSRIARRGR